jgi:hydroxymethylglutaryl-CoA lyase
VSPTFLQNNQHQTLEDAIEELEKVNNQGEQAGLETVVYISMAFGNPYGDPWNVGEVVDAVELLEAEGVRTISLADTVGLAGPAQIRELFEAVNSKYGYLEIGLHLHSRPDQAVEKIQAAYDAGCRRFDSALGGLGGCPFAQDALVGNIATEKVVEALTQRGAELPALKPLDVLLRVTNEIGARYSVSAAAD